MVGTAKMDHLDNWIRNFAGIYRSTYFCMGFSTFIRSFSLNVAAVYGLVVLPATGIMQAQSPVVIFRTDRFLFIDGNGNEPAWQAAPAFPPFVFPWYTGGPQEQTETKLLWDDRFLYALFRCEDAHISGARTQ